MRQKMLVIEIPMSLSVEINKFLAKKAQGQTTQGMKKAIVIQSLFEFLKHKEWKMNKTTNKECMEIIDNARFKI